MNNKLVVALLSALLPSTVFAHNLTIGEPLPHVAIVDKGEITLNKETLTYQPWDSASLAGKTRVIQAIAGRSAAKAMNAELMTAITAAQFPAEQYQTTTIINQDDTIWGTGSFVKSSAEDSKREFSWSAMVLDANGVAQSKWQLAKESSAIIILDKAGKVRFIQEGKLPPEAIQQALNTIKEHL
ncbi:YtfJ family protein [Photobacterium japonica]|uniref:YtfJ family protein n=1 Tax=Photobacterium japonica TaxID=2910235 RepID=UPI003D12E3AE